jgi:ubiquinone/menaquinone biosynthesis C-methylase UbiE
MRSQVISEKGLLEKKVRDSESCNYVQNQISVKTISYLNFERKLIIKSLQSFYQNGMKNPILDAACGVGIITLPLLNLNKEVYALDFSEESLAVLKERIEKSEPSKNINLQLKLIHGSVTNLCFTDNFFSAITLLLVVQHLPPEEQSAAMKECYNKLVNQGILLCTVFNEKKFLSKGKSKTGYFEKGNPYYSFSKADLIHLANNAGFTQIEILPIGIFLFLSHMPMRGFYRLYRIFSPLLHSLEYFLHHKLVKRLFSRFLFNNINSSDYWFMICKK